MPSESAKITAIELCIEECDTPTVSPPGPDQVILARAQLAALMKCREAVRPYTDSYSDFEERVVAADAAATEVGL